MRTVTVRGKSYDVKRSNKKGKKYKAKVGSSWMHFGARGYIIAPGTSKGDNYCARSFGITSRKKGVTPNDLSRAMWGCKGKKSYR